LTLEEAFKELPTFATDRLRVSPLREADAQAIFTIRSDPRVTEPYGAEPHKSLSETMRWVEDRLADYQRRDSMTWVLSPREENKAIGSCCYWHFDVESKIAEVGYELHPGLAQGHDA
jgi:[ribosomal protein S5]-alanine N-acetyltransferase